MAPLSGKYEIKVDLSDFEGLARAYNLSRHICNNCIVSSSGTLVKSEPLLANIFVCYFEEKWVINNSVFSGRTRESGGSRA